MGKDEIIEYLETLEQRDNDNNTSYTDLQEFINNEGWRVHVDIALDGDENTDYYYCILIDDLVDNKKISKEDLSKWFLHGWKLNTTKNCIIKNIKKDI